MNIVYHNKPPIGSLPRDAIAETYLFCIEITDINSHAKALITEINDTSWISELESIAKMSYEDIALKTIKRLVKIFESVNNKVTKDFGEFMVSMSSGNCLKDKHNHKVLPLAEIWKPKLLQNEWFDFHTLSPAEKFSFWEAKYVSDGNSYNEAAKQAYNFSVENKDKRDGVHLRYFGSSIAIQNLENNKRWFVVSFSINSEDYKNTLMRTLKNRYIRKLSKCCDELYIIGVKIWYQKK